MKISVMIATCNRCVELRRTLTKLFELDPRAGEILICADGCIDETVEMVRQEFPGCKLIENETAHGSVFSRDRLLRLAQSDIVMSLDDDSYPIDRDFLSRLGEAFESHPEAAVITFMELRGENATSAGPAVDLSRGQYVAAYPNCAAAMRRSRSWTPPGRPASTSSTPPRPTAAAGARAGSGPGAASAMRRSC